jgi:hypothetical protein
MEGTNLPNIQSREIQPATGTAREYKALLTGQTVCTVKNEKGENCQGHVKQWQTAPPDALKKAAAGNTLHRCQRCFTIYEGPPQEYLHPKPKSKAKK